MSIPACGHLICPKCYEDWKASRNGFYSCPTCKKIDRVPKKHDIKGFSDWVEAGQKVPGICLDLQLEF